MLFQGVFGQIRKRFEDHDLDDPEDQEETTSIGRQPDEVSEEDEEISWIHFKNYVSTVKKTQF